jgi:molybdopterin molybdotransferase
MISTTEAKQIISENCTALQSEIVQLKDAHGKYLANPVISKYDHPFFDQSAMDGYAVRWEDLNKFEFLKVAGEIPAGRTDLPILKSGEAFRIYTGAAIPAQCDTVVIQENVQRIGDKIKVLKVPALSSNIRKKGEQILNGSVALEAGHLLNAAAIGFLASIGIANVSVYLSPKVSIINTGSEFLSPGATLIPGMIFESNGIMLQSALKEAGISAVKTTCIDNLETLQNLITKTATRNDVLLITGGVSVGDYDFTPEALKASGFEVLFHKIYQKPGKPLLFAKNKNGTLAFGLPGNPHSVLNCFYQYVIPALRKIQAATSTSLTSCYLPVLQDVKNKSGKTLFLSATISEEGVKPMSGQGSHTLSNPAKADATIQLPASATDVIKGEKVLTYILPR